MLKQILYVLFVCGVYFAMGQVRPPLRNRAIPAVQPPNTGNNNGTNEGLTFADPDTELPPSCNDRFVASVLERVTGVVREDFVRTARTIQEMLETELNERGRWQVIVSECDFAFANWVSELSCKMIVNGLHVIAWRH